MSAAATPPGASNIAAAIQALDTALMKLGIIRNAPSGAPDFKLFELKIAIRYLRRLSKPGSWCLRTNPATATTVALSSRAREWSKATVFTSSSSKLALALNVNVHYQHSPPPCWVGARHEADVALVRHIPSPGRRHLDSSLVLRVIEAKYQKRVDKSVLRELAFIARQLPNAPRRMGQVCRVLLSTPLGSVKVSSIPDYWAQAPVYYEVKVLNHPFP